MAIDYGSPNTTRYVSYGNSVSLVTTRPFAIAALLDSTNWRTSGVWNSFFQNGTTGTSGFYFTIRAAASPVLDFVWSTPTEIGVVSTFTLAANTGWWMVAVSVWDAGASSSAAFYAYRYSNSTLQSQIITGRADSNPVAVGAQATIIGASTQWSEYYPGKIGWLAVFTDDIGNQGSATAPKVWELITRGPWGMLDANCKFFVPFTNAAMDIVGKRDGTLTGSPTYVGGGPAGEAFASAMPVIVTDVAPPTSMPPPFLTIPHPVYRM